MIKLPILIFLSSLLLLSCNSPNIANQNSCQALSTYLSINQENLKNVWAITSGQVYQIISSGDQNQCANSLQQLAQLEKNRF